MEKELIDIWIVEERRTRNTHAVCFSLKEAEDAYKYLTECIGWQNDAFCIREATAYPNGWHRDLLDHYKQMQEGGTK